MQMKNLFFVFCTLVCTSTSARDIDADAHLAKQLSSGLGGLIVKISSYKGDKDFNEKDLEKYSSIQSLLDSVGKPKKLSRRIRLYLLSPDSKQKEKRFKLYPDDSFFIFIGVGGRYTLSRLTLASAGGGTSSHRFFRKVVIEGGKLKYLGDIKVIDFSRLFSIKKGHQPLVFYDFDPDVFRRNFQRRYSLSAQYLVSEKLGD